MCFEHHQVYNNSCTIITLIHALYCSVASCAFIFFSLHQIIFMLSLRHTQPNYCQPNADVLRITEYSTNSAHDWAKHDSSTEKQGKENLFALRKSVMAFGKSAEKKNRVYIIIIWPWPNVARKFHVQEECVWEARVQMLSSWKFGEV